MNRTWWTRLTLRWAWISGAAVAALSLLLITDGFLERGRVSREKAIVEALEARVPTEAEAAEELASVTELQTARSVAREQRNLQLGWTLLAATILFLGSAKGHQELRHGRQPSLVTISGRLPLAAARPTAPAIDRQRDAQTPVEVDVGYVDEVIASQGRSRETAIPILQALQTHYRYLPEAALRRVCETTEIEPAQIVGVASFYAQFRRDPVGRLLVRVCHGTACHVAGIGPIMDEMRRRLEIEPDADTDPWRRFTLESVNCLGCCSLAPVMMVEDHVAGRLTPTRAWEELQVVEAET